MTTSTSPTSRGFGERGTAVAEVIEQQRLFIGGDWKPANSGVSIPVHSANTERLIGLIAQPSYEDLDEAVLAARAAFDDPTGWSHWEPEARAEAMHRLADAIDRRAGRIAPLVSDQNGMPISLATAVDASWPGHMLRLYATFAAEQSVEETRTSSMGGRTLVRRVPVGVVVGIMPWNFPNTLAALQYAPALAAGCTVVLKPAPETTLDAILISEAVIEAGLPPGVINIVPGARKVGAYLVEHPAVDKVTFTGSTAAGRRIGEICGHLLRPATLELGGKSAAIVLDDADFATAAMAQNFVPALFGNNGQTCFLTSRVLAPRSRYDEVVDAIADLARSLTVGNSLDPSTQVGPLVSQAQRTRVEGYIASGIEQGARLVLGGGRPEGLAAGWFVEPTVFADVDNSFKIAREEIFGPVVTVTPYDDDADAVRLANDSEYGLAATVWTADHERGLAIARQIHSGSVGINHYTADMNSPTTMLKASGLGSKLGPEALATYQRFQSLYL